MGRASRSDSNLPFNLPESGQVTVACKLPNGLILQLCRLEDGVELVMGGGTRVIQKAVKYGEQVILNKARVPFGEIPEYKVIGGYALTEDVDAQFFAEWCRQNADSDLIKNKLIFAFERADQVASTAREQKGVQSGLQPVLTTRDPRMPKDIRIADTTNKDMAA